MKDYREASRRLASLRDRPWPVADPRGEPSRERVVGQLKCLLRELPSAPPRPNWSRRLRLGVVLAAAAALVVVGGWISQRLPSSAGTAVLELEPQGEVVVLVADRRTRIELGARTRLPARGKLTTAGHSSANITTPSGLRVVVGGGSELSLDELATRHGVLALTQGKVECHVPRQQPGESFSVVTPDAKVAVRGTVFSVDLSSTAGATRTCVRVSEGVVSVFRTQGEERLSEGQSSGCEQPLVAVPTPSAVGAPAPAPTVEASDERRPPRSEKSPTAPSVRGSLGEESALLRAALLEEQRGNPDRARAKLDELLQRYPASVLVPDARRALARLDQRAGR